MSLQLFSDAEIGLRYNHLFRLTEQFCSAYNSSHAVQAEVDPSRLYLVVVATYDDIARYKEYHLSSPATQRSNAIKRGAYAAKWLMHFSPIIFPDVGHLRNSNNASHDCLINAAFAVHFALINVQQFTSVNCDLADEIHYSLLYDLMYRNIGGETLILFLEAVATIASGKKLIQ